MTLHPIPLNFLIYEENFIFFFYQCRDEGERGGEGRICSVSSFDNVVSSFHENLLQNFATITNNVATLFCKLIHCIVHINISSEFTRITLTDNLKEVGSAWLLQFKYCAFHLPAVASVFRVLLFARSSVRTS